MDESSQGYDFFNRPLYDPEDFPSIVWLRGDEPYVDQFSLEADEVMSILQIKRARLTQISGKELRVGRKRSGRYVKPVYRLDDVESYKNWTRAPATHSRTAGVLNEASQKLREGSDHLLQQSESFKEIQSQHLTEILSSIEDSKNALKNQIKNLNQLTALQLQKSPSKPWLQEHFDTMNMGVLDDLNQKQNSTTADFKIVFQYQRELDQKSSENHLRLLHQFELIQNEINDLKNKVEDIRNQIDDLKLNVKTPSHRKITSEKKWDFYSKKSQKSIFKKFRKEARNTYL